MEVSEERGPGGPGQGFSPDGLPHIKEERELGMHLWSLDLRRKTTGMCGSQVSHLSCSSDKPGLGWALGTAHTAHTCCPRQVYRASNTTQSLKSTRVTCLVVSWGFLSLWCTYPHRSRLLREARSGAQTGKEARAMEEWCLLACFLQQVIATYTAQVQLARGGTTHSGLGSLAFSSS